MNIAEILGNISLHQYHHSRERGLQDGIEQVLRRLGLDVRREHPLGDAGTIDFYLPEVRLGIEVKSGRTGGGPSKVAQQLARYAEHPDIAELAIVSTRASLRLLPHVLCGKPLNAVLLFANGL